MLASTLEIKVRYSNFKTITKRKRLKTPTRNPGEIYRETKTIFLPIFEKSKLAIRLLGVSAKNLLREVPLNIFEKREKEEKFVDSIFKVRKKFGFGSVLSGREMFLSALYRTSKEGFILKTASLTR